jgi:hypothetical protein
MEQIKIPISHDKLLKLARGHVVQISKEMLGGAISNVKPVPLMIEAKKARRIIKAMREGKGSRLQLSREEIEGSGLKDWVKKAKKGAKQAGDFYKKHLKETVAPILKKGAKTALDIGLTALEVDQPELAPAIEYFKKSGLDDKLVSKVGDVTGAYGMVPGMLPGADTRFNPEWQMRNPYLLPNPWAVYGAQPYSGFGRQGDQWGGAYMNHCGCGGSFRNIG